jgi:hypothetical protein
MEGLTPGERKTTFPVAKHFLADLEKSSGIMEKTISSFISKCQMAAQFHRYLNIAKKRVPSEPVYAHLSGVRAYTSSQCMRTERVKFRVCHKNLSFCEI